MLLVVARDPEPRVGDVATGPGARRVERAVADLVVERMVRRHRFAEPLLEPGAAEVERLGVEDLPTLPVLLRMILDVVVPVRAGADGRKHGRASDVALEAIGLVERAARDQRLVECGDDVVVVERRGVRGHERAKGGERVPVCVHVPGARGDPEHRDEAERRAPAHRAVEIASREQRFERRKRSRDRVDRDRRRDRWRRGARSALAASKEREDDRQRERGELSAQGGPSRAPR